MLWFVGRLQGGQSMILKGTNNSVGIAYSLYILLMSEMGRGSSLVVAEVFYLLSLRELRYWILRFDKDCLSNGVFLMDHVPKSVKHLYIEHHSIASCTKKTQQH